jgi:hypothetical protein
MPAITVTTPEPVLTAAMLPDLASRIGTALDQRDALLCTAAEQSVRIGLGLLHIEQLGLKGALTTIYKLLGKRASSARHSLRFAKDFAAKTKDAPKLLTSHELTDMSTGQLRLALEAESESPLNTAIKAWVQGRSINRILQDLSGQSAAELQATQAEDDAAEAEASEPSHGQPKRLPTSGGSRDASDEVRKRELMQEAAADALDTLRQYLTGRLYEAHDIDTLTEARELLLLGVQAIAELVEARSLPQPKARRVKPKR